MLNVNPFLNLGQNCKSENGWRHIRRDMVGHLYQWDLRHLCSAVCCAQKAQTFNVLLCAVLVQFVFNLNPLSKQQLIKLLETFQMKNFGEHINSC